MSVSDTEKEHEKRRLEGVLDEIAGQLAQRQADVAKYRSLFTGIQESLQEDGPRTVMGFEDLVEIAGGMNKLKAAAKFHRFSQNRAQQLERLLKSPYFARVDFRESADLPLKPST